MLSRKKRMILNLAHKLHIETKQRKTALNLHAFNLLLFIGSPQDITGSLLANLASVTEGGTPVTTAATRYVNLGFRQENEQLSENGTIRTKILPLKPK